MVVVVVMVVDVVDGGGGMEQLWHIVQRAARSPPKTTEKGGGDFIMTCLLKAKFSRIITESRFRVQGLTWLVGGIRAEQLEDCVRFDFRTIFIRKIDYLHSIQRHLYSLNRRLIQSSLALFVNRSFPLHLILLD